MTRPWWISSARLMDAAALAMALLTLGVSGAALADGHVAVEAADQSVAGGVVAAEAVMAEERGWLVVHRTDAQMKPGPVVGHAPLGPGLNRDVKALLTEPVAPGERLMLMIHSEAGGARPGIFEYVLGAKEDGPIREDGRLVMAVIEAQ